MAKSKPEVHPNFYLFDENEWKWKDYSDSSLEDSNSDDAEESTTDSESDPSNENSPKSKKDEDEDEEKVKVDPNMPKYQAILRGEDPTKVKIERPEVSIPEIRPDSYPAARDSLDSEVTLREIGRWEMSGGQGTVASLAKLGNRIGHKLLAAAVRSPVMELEILGSLASAVSPIYGLMASWCEVNFDDVPPGMPLDITAVDSYSKKGNPLDHVVVLGMAKYDQVAVKGCAPPGNVQEVPRDGLIQVYLCDPHHPGDLDEADTFIVHSEYIPVHVTHVEVPVDVALYPGISETAIVVAGDDDRVHVYIENRLDDDEPFVRADTEAYFPELARVFNSIVQWVDFVYLDPQFSRRLTAVSTECGLVMMFLVDLREEEPRVVRTWTRAISDAQAFKVQFFRPNLKSTPPPSRFEHFAPRRPKASAAAAEMDYETLTDVEAIDLLAVAGVSASCVFHDVARNGLAVCKDLPGATEHDQVNGGVAVDVDCDGVNEIILGAYGERIMVFKFDPETEKWVKKWTRETADPVLAVEAADLTADGMTEVAVMTTKHVQVFQNDPKAAGELRTKRMARILELGRGKL